MLSQLDAFSQALSGLEGRVLDENKHPIPFITIFIIAERDSSTLSATRTDESGIFRFSMPTERYRIKASALGYKNHVSRSFVQGSFDTLPDIILLKEETKLREVVITQRRNPVEIKGGNLVFNVDASPVSTGNSAFDLLQKIPGVSVDQSDNIVFKGSSAVNIMIDGKLSQISAQQLSNMLKGMGASAISRVELINSPGSQFDAAGSSGSINIITKKTNKKGYAADISAGTGAGQYFLHRESIAGNIRNDRFNIFGSLGYDNRHYLALKRGNQLKGSGRDEVLYLREIEDETQTHYYSYKAGIDLYLPRKTELGFFYTGYTDDWSRNAGGATQVLANQNNLQSVVQNNNILKEPYYNNGFNLNFKKGLDTLGKTLSLNADYISFRNNSDGFIGNSWANVDGNEIGPYQQLNFHQPSFVDIRSLKADFDLPSHTIDFKAGLKYAKVNIDNEFKYDSLVNNHFVPASSLSDHFVYGEQISAVYFSGKRSWKTTTIEAGIRMEHTLTDANSISSSIRTRRDYTNLFPSFSLEQKLNGSHSVSLSLSRRINRPLYNNLNPVRYFYDKYYYYQGNPLLQPERAWVSTIIYTLHQKYIVSLTYNRANNFISQSAVVNPDAVLITSNINFGKRERLDLQLSSPINYTRFWSSSNTVSLNYTHYPLQQLGGIKSAEKFAIDVISNHSLTLPKKVSGEVNFHYTSPTLNGVYIYRQFFSVDAGLKKTFAKRKIDVRASLSDIFRTIRYSGYSITNTANSWYNNLPDSRRLNVSLIYHLGGKLARGKTQRLEEQERL